MGVLRTDQGRITQEVMSLSGTVLVSTVTVESVQRLLRVLILTGKSMIIRCVTSGTLGLSFFTEDESRASTGITSMTLTMTRSPLVQLIRTDQAVG